MLDGEIWCLEPDGRTNFTTLLFRYASPHFYAFDVLRIDGEDLRALPLLERKGRLRRIQPTRDSRLRSLDHLAERGCDPFRMVCERDLEGFVAKWAPGTYRTDGRATSWLKIKNPDYTHIHDRHELFASRQAAVPQRRDHQRPDLVLC